MPQKMKCKQEVWIPISIFCSAASVIPNVFLPSCRYCRNSLTERDQGLFKRLASNGGGGGTVALYDIDVCSGTLITHTLDQM